MTNARQKDAFECGSAFSRGAWIREPDMTQVQVSGTAAIVEQGNPPLNKEGRTYRPALFGPPVSDSGLSQIFVTWLCN